MASDSTHNIREYSVSELAGAVKRVIEDGFGFVRVKGELGRVTRCGVGHLYLDLKDENATISGVVWKGAAQLSRVEPEQGMEVVATGQAHNFPRQSKYQIIIDSLEPAGAGALMAILEERKKRLAAEGLFDAARKRPIPFLPEVIGVVDLAFGRRHSRHPSPSPRPLPAPCRRLADACAGKGRGDSDRGGDQGL